ncbi:MAG TPA: hypothetical protein DCX32_00565 [Candidatus Moranbacteria bacterium]|nr:MAG: hypothetical protein UW87_C0006G0039 [Candidatus Moranbacteria bacterium GW2011_GWC2_45_10]KKT95565.1 MAG: hypothetical protein UW95_C0001G0129 [Parcubacteria group bacterium GW2011_GWC1_45_14]HAV11030.1 hypothetical protein [Candidatus Moranbacteria bacterium]
MIKFIKQLKSGHLENEDEFLEIEMYLNNEKTILSIHGQVCAMTNLDFDNDIDNRGKIFFDKYSDKIEKFILDIRKMKNIKGKNFLINSDNIQVDGVKVALFEECINFFK